MGSWVALMACSVAITLAVPADCTADISAADQTPAAATPMGTADMAHMSGHMYMATLRPLSPGDQQKADAVLAAARTAMAPYKDYHKALADGYRIVYPYETVPSKIWSTDDDAEGHDNMDHASMPGMKMN
jgi:hypothetical protein